MPREYWPRVVDAQLTQGLRSAGAVLIEGPKASGKTSTAREQAASFVRLDASPQVRASAQADPSILLGGTTPRLIDEWQLVPDVWNAVRAAVDDRGEAGQFILTGSSAPTEDITRHSGAGRFTRLRMYPMSLFETHDSTGEVSLANLLDGDYPSVLGETDLIGMAKLVVRGGWPINLGRSLEDAVQVNRDYLASIAGTDIVTLDGVRRDPRKVTALLYALARSTGTYVTNRVLQTDSANVGELTDPRTINSYLDALTRIWVLVEQPAWGQHLRSSAQVRRSPKRHLADPSLAAAAMGASYGALVADHETFGCLFESLVHRDLTVYAQAIGADVRAYQDNRGGEIDEVIVREGRWAGIEVKLSPNPRSVDAGAESLRRIAATMRHPPTSLTVVTAGGPSYRRKDGVNVVSILHLGP